MRKCNEILTARRVSSPAEHALLAFSAVAEKDALNLNQASSFLCQLETEERLFVFVQISLLTAPVSLPYQTGLHSGSLHQIYISGLISIL